MTQDAIRRWRKHRPAPATVLTLHDSHALLAATSLKLRKSAWARTWLLVVSSVTALIIGIGYWNGLPASPEPQPGLLILDGAGGLEFWSIVWMVAGFSGLIATLTGRRAALVIIAQASLSGFWAGCYVLGWILEGGRGYLTGAIFVLIDVLTLSLLMLPWDRRVSWTSTSGK